MFSNQLYSNGATDASDAEHRYVRKRQVLEAFWNERIVKRKQKSVDRFKGYIKAILIHKNPQLINAIDSLFSDAISQQIDFSAFFEKLPTLPYNLVMEMALIDDLYSYLIGKRILHWGDGNEPSQYMIDQHDECVSTYKFNKSNTNYINIINEYNKMCFINTINRMSVMGGNLTCSDLIEILGYLTDDEITITCSMAIFDSKMEILPKIDSLLIKSCCDPLVAYEDHLYIDGLSKSVGLYMQSHTHRKTTPPDEAPEPPEIGSINKMHAFLLVDKINRVIPLSGALHLPKIQSILVQNGKDNYLLQYGDNPGITLLPTLHFDIDDGFLCRTTHSHDTVLAEINNFFNAWKANQYTGRIFAESDLIGKSLLYVVRINACRNYSNHYFSFIPNDIKNMVCRFASSDNSHAFTIESPSIQVTNDGTERVFREFDSAQSARDFSIFHSSATPLIRPEPINLHSNPIPATVDFPLDEESFVLSPNWKPRQGN